MFCSSQFIAARDDSQVGEIIADVTDITLPPPAPDTHLKLFSKIRHRHGLPEQVEIESHRGAGFEVAAVKQCRASLRLPIWPATLHTSSGFFFLVQHTFWRMAKSEP